jgi:hypothetical protein
VVLFGTPVLEDKMRVILSGCVVALILVGLSQTPNPPHPPATQTAVMTDKSEVQSAALLSAKINKTSACTQIVPCVEVQRSESSINR